MFGMEKTQLGCNVELLVDTEVSLVFLGSFHSLYTHQWIKTLWSVTHEDNKNDIVTMDPEKLSNIIRP